MGWIRSAIESATATGELNFPQDSELSIVLTDDRSIRELNKFWRQIDKPTNVLSFPGQNTVPGDLAGPVLGDIVLAHETLSLEAREQQISLRDHFTHLIIHGFLHLFGYDHENDIDAGIMERKESEALARLDIADPYDENSYEFG